MADLYQDLNEINAHEAEIEALMDTGMSRDAAELVLMLRD